MRSVQGARVLVAPQRGTGTQGLTLAQVELSGNATIGDLAKAIEGAQTPHRQRVPPGAVVVVPAKLKPTATPEAILEALRKADLVAQ